MERVIAYIDGFNLYYGLRERYGRRYLWLDLPGLVKSLLRNGQQLELTRYCTARISKPNDSVRRQATFIDALNERGGVVVHEGKFQPKTVHCHRCGRSWPTHEEKQTDGNLAVEMLKDAHRDRFDMALLVSGDSDLAPAVRAVRSCIRRSGSSLPFHLLDIRTCSGRRPTVASRSAEARLPRLSCRSQSPQERATSFAGRRSGREASPGRADQFL